MNKPAYNFFAASPKRLVEIRQLAVSLFGEGVSPLDLMEEWSVQNPDIFMALCRDDGQGNIPLAGYLCMVPLTGAGEAGIVNGEFNGTNIPVSLIAEPEELAKAVYIGAIAGTSREDQRFIMKLMVAHLRDYATKGIKFAYGRAATADGKRIFEQRLGGKSLGVAGKTSELPLYRIALQQFST